MGKILNGKVVLVTGAGGGIGREVALMAAAEGAAVVVNDLGATLKGVGQTITAAQAVVNEIKAAGGNAIADGGSVTDPDAARAMVEAAVKEFGRIDAVVNNAGILRDGFFHKMTYDDFDAVVKVHLYGAFNTSRAAADYFREQQSGALVHMTSTSGLIGNYAQANYSAAKLGIAAFSRAVALDLRRWNVRSNCIAPFAWSRMISSIKTDTPEQEARVEKIKKMTPAKVAPMACYLMSDEAADVSGQIFAVRMNEVFLMSQPRPVRSVHSGDGWTPDTIAVHAVPALKSHFTPLEVSADVFFLGSRLMARRKDKITSAIAWSKPDKISVRGLDLTNEILGHMNLGDLAFLQLTGRRATPQESQVFNALVITLVEHGITPSALAARMTYMGAPESLQAAVAAGLCGLGTVFVGSMEGASKMLYEALPEDKLGTGADLDAIAAKTVETFRRRRTIVPGLGHPVHKPVDPRAPRLFQIAAENGKSGEYVALIQKIQAAAEKASGKMLPINATGAIGAICCEFGFPWKIVRGFGVMARAIGLVGHILEESENPISYEIWQRAEEEILETSGPGEHAVE